jgi:hypothetical protein
MWYLIVICSIFEYTSFEGDVGYGSLDPPRPDLLAYREATSLEFSKLVKELTAILGKKLTAYIASVKDTARSIGGLQVLNRTKESRNVCVFAYRLAKVISDQDGPRVVQTWFTGLNPELNDRVPIRLLREEDIESVGPQILGAARAFLPGASYF